VLLTYHRHVTLSFNGLMIGGKRDSLSQMPESREGEEWFYEGETTLQV